MNQQLYQIIVNDVSSNAIGRILHGRLNPNRESNFIVMSELGPLLVSMGGWNLPRAPNTTRVHVVIVGDQIGNLEQFFSSLDAMSPTFMPGDKLVYVQQNLKQLKVDRANWCNYNYTRVQMNLFYVQVQNFLDLVTDVVKNDQRSIVDSAHY